MTTTNPQSPAIAAYLKELERALKPLPADERDDVMRELRAHLEDGLAAGKTPEAILAGMGPAREVAEALVSERLVTVDQKRTPGAIAWMFAKAAGMPFMVATASLIVLLVGNTWYVYHDLLIAERTPIGTVFFLLLYNLPALIVVNLPMAALMAGLSGIPKLATMLSAPTLKRMYPRLVAAGLLTGLLISGLGFALNNTLVPTANRLTVDLVRVFVLHWSYSPDDMRSPQEMSLDQVDRHIATLRAERDRLAASGATFKVIHERDTALRRMEVDRHLKLSLPSYAFSLMALGMAVGTLLAGRRPVPVWVNVIVAVLTVAAIYAMMNLARFSEAFSGSPALAAWSPVGLTLGLAAAVWAYARITGKGVYADV